MFLEKLILFESPFKKVTAGEMYKLAQYVNVMESINSENYAEADVKKFLKGIKKAAKQGFYRYYTTVEDSDSIYRFAVLDRLREHGFRAHWEAETLVRYQLNVSWDLSRND